MQAPFDNTFFVLSPHHEAATSPSHQPSDGCNPVPRYRADVCQRSVGCPKFRPPQGFNLNRSEFLVEFMLLCLQLFVVNEACRDLTLLIRGEPFVHDDVDMRDTCLPPICLLTMKPRHRIVEPHVPCHCSATKPADDSMTFAVTNTSRLLHELLNEANHENSGINSVYREVFLPIGGHFGDHELFPNAVQLECNLPSVETSSRLLHNSDLLCS
mmetsp:Transcript_61135/g.162415  ORF Transcript_61135/g.162415 Transcript_61135/m.162415 type:complete len:213 (-) Transcript_61135:249-887(-)